VRQQSNSDQQMSLRSRWSSSTSARISSAANLGAPLDGRAAVLAAPPIARV
jgi:hypothetical protein